MAVRTILEIDSQETAGRPGELIRAENLSAAGLAADWAARRALLDRHFDETLADAIANSPPLTFGDGDEDSILSVAVELTRSR